MLNVGSKVYGYARNGVLVYDTIVGETSSCWKLKENGLVYKDGKHYMLAKSPDVEGGAYDHVILYYKPRTKNDFSMWFEAL